MTLISSGTDNGPAGRRVIRRFTGAVRGSLLALAPYLFVFEDGATRLGANSRDESMAGRFVLGAPAGHGIAFRTGMILPLARCRDVDLRRQLRMLASTLSSDEAHMQVDPARMALAESVLATSSWADTLRLDPRFGARGECVFEATPGLVPLLHRSFDYVRELEDDPRGDAVPLAYAPFPADTYGNLMEWCHGLSASKRWQRSIWNRLNVALVFDDNADAFVSFGAKQGLEQEVALDLEYLLRDANTLVGSVEVRLDVVGYGGVRCGLAAGGSETSHYFSNTYPPFDDLLAWCKAVRDDRAPIVFSFEEEGPDTNFEAHRLGPDRILFLVRRTYSGRIHLACVRSASGLAECFRVELASFFRDRFDSEHWEEFGDRAQKFVSLRSRMLGDPWLGGAPGANASRG